MASARPWSTRSGRPASTASRTWSSRRSSRSGRPFTSSATPVSSATAQHLLEVERVRRPVVDQAPRRVAEAARGRMPHRLDDPRGQLPPPRALPGVQRDLDPVELGEDVVGEVERPVREDVALDPAQDAERRERVVRGRDLLALAPHRVGVEPRDDPHCRVWSQIARYSYPRARGGLGHLEHRGLPVGPGRVHVEVAAHVLEARRAGGESGADGASRSSGGIGAMPSAAKSAFSSARPGSGSSGRTSASGPVARKSSVPNRPGGAATTSTGTPSTVTPTARSGSVSTTATTCGSAREPVEHGVRLGRRHDGEPLGASRQRRGRRPPRRRGFRDPDPPAPRPG